MLVMGRRKVIPADPSTLGGRIRIARTRKGLHVAELAAKMNVSHPAVTKWESNKSACSPDDLIRLAEILEVSPVWLLTGENALPTRKMPLANTVRDLVELSILIRQGKVEEWEGDMVEVAVTTQGEFCVVVSDDSMMDRMLRGDVVSCTLDVRLADGAVVLLKVPDSNYPVFRQVERTGNGVRFVPRRKVQGKYVDRVYEENEVKVLARAVEIVKGRL
jgi:transcriptional regulator with XRE-family HTH domain